MSLARALSHHERGDLRRAEAAYRQILRSHPACHEALHGLGLIMHQQGRQERARSLIEQAVKLSPEHADYHYHLAEVLRGAGEAREALPRYREAIRLAHGEADYYFGLGNALADAGAPEEAIDAYRQAAALAPGDAEILNNLGNLLADQARLPEALQCLRKAVALCADYAGAHHNLAVALAESGHRDEALEHARRACGLAPEDAEPRMLLGRLLGEAGRPTEAVRCLRRAMSLGWNEAAVVGRAGDRLRDLDAPEAALEAYRRAAELAPAGTRYHNNAAPCLIRLNRIGEARAASEQALANDPDNATAISMLATCLQVQGDFDGAAEMLRRALELQPTLTRAAYQLAVNGASYVSDDELQRWHDLADAGELGDEKHYHLQFALAKVYEQREKYDCAFDHYQRGNDIKARLYPFNTKQHSDYVNRIIATFDTDFFSRRGHFGLCDARPVFIVGMPRSGSTLVEQILASHPQVAAAGEHREIREIVRELPVLADSPQPVPECCGELTGEHCLMLARRYLDSLPDGAAEAVRVCDKMLGNFLRLGLIALLFPRARVIHCRRNPLDTCVSCYTQDFDHGLRFTTSLQNLATFYRNYRKLMDHWHEVLPLPVLNVEYEKLVADPESGTRALLEFCDLPWDERCLSPHRTRRDIATASVWQARQPIYRSSVARWRRYEQHLGPLIEGLRQGGFAA